MMIAVLTAGLALGDLALKWLIERQDPEQFPRPLKHTKGKILLYRNHNAGFPFGFMERYGELVRTIPLVIISALGGVLYCLCADADRTTEKTVQKLGLAVLLGGALSNLFDRYVRRYVVDYFSIQVGALKKVVFNLGDMFVFLGSGILLCLEIVKEIRAGLHK